MSHGSGGRDRRGRSKEPERITRAVGRFADAVAPETPEARAQTVWADAVGPELAAVTRVTDQREGTVLVECESAVWAEELALMETRIRKSLNQALAARGEDPVEMITFRSGEL